MFHVRDTEFHIKATRNLQEQTVFTMVVPGEGAGGLLHVDIRGIIFSLKTVMNVSVFNLLCVCFHDVEFLSGSAM